MAKAQVGFQPRNTPAERRAFFDLQRKQGASAGPLLFYQYASATATPPGSGNIRFNHADQTLATHAYIHNITTDALDLGIFNTLSVAPGDLLLIQDRNDHTRHQLYRIGGKPNEMGSYIDVPVSWVRGGIAIPNAQACFIVFIHE